MVLMSCVAVRWTPRTLGRLTAVRNNGLFSVRASADAAKAEIIFATVPAPQHDMGGHPECAARVPAILDALKKHHLLPSPVSNNVVELTEFPAASLKDIMQVHSDQYVLGLEQYSQKSLSPRASIIESLAPTYATSSTFGDSLKAAGAAMALVDAVIESTQNGTSGSVGFGICRPPGHHAVPVGAMGFCIFGTAAIAVRHVQQHHQLNKVMIYDFDVHHGNGTQDIFYNDPSVLVISTHQDGSYPGTGKILEVGGEGAEGMNINVPLPLGSGDTAVMTTFDEIVVPAAQKFQPEMIIASAGYDAHVLDPLGSLQFTASTYNALCQRLRQLSKDLCHGRLVLLLEGGYHLKALGESVADSFFGLMHQPSIDSIDKTGLRAEPTDTVKSLLERVAGIHEMK